MRDLDKDMAAQIRAETIEEGSFSHWVNCPTCGNFAVDDVDVIEIDGNQINWRCPNCNEILYSDIMIAD